MKESQIRFPEQEVQTQLHVWYHNNLLSQKSINRAIRNKTANMPLYRSSPNEKKVENLKSSRS